MSFRTKVLIDTLSGLQTEDFNKVEKLILSSSAIKKLKEDQNFQNIIKQIAKNIKYLRFKSLESLNVLAQNGQFNLKDFENLQQLSISSDYSGISLEAASEFFNTVFDQLSQPKKLNKIYIDLDNFELGFDQIAQISTKISQLQNLETLRLELGHNQLKDEGCQCITQAISKLTLLKELILGLENNQLGNFSFKQVFLMISQLVNLERLQIDFWGNESNDLAYEDLYEILRNSKVCNNLKEVRMYCDTPYRIKKNPIKLIDSFGLFNSLTKISFSVDQYNFLLETAIGLNTILINNCKTLKTVMIDFLKNQDQQNFEPSNQIQAVFKNMDKMVNLENLFIQFHSKQSYSSACDFFEEIKKCPKLLRLGITSSFSEVSTSSLGQVIDYFKTILEIQFLLQFEYAKYSSDLDFLWYDCFFQQDWSYKHFIDPYLVNQACFNIKDQKQRKHFCQLIQDIQEQYIGDGDSFDSHQYSEEGEEDDDEEEADYGPDESSYEENNDEDDEVDSIDLGNNQEVQQNSDEEEEHDNFVYGEVEKSNNGGISNKLKQQAVLSFNEQQIMLDKQFKFDTCLKQHKLMLYLIVQRHYNFKMTELIRLIAYNKTINDVLISQFTQTSVHIKKNYWDLHL
ncbi:hypothetical protein ABPG74_011911 [Tetrahymena malaccensis]